MMNRSTHSDDYLWYMENVKKDSWSRCTVNSTECSDLVTVHSKKSQCSEHSHKKNNKNFFNLISFFPRGVIRKISEKKQKARA